MMMGYYKASRSVVQRAPFQINTFLTVRSFSVKEINWCAPSGSITSRSQPAPTTSSSKQPSENDDERPIEKFGIVAAISSCKNRVIGIDGKLPWSVPKDRRIFTSLTRDGILIIGRKTLEEKPSLSHINHAKHCIVVSKNLNDLKGYYKTENADSPNDLQLCLARSLDEALVKARELNNNDSESEAAADEPIACWVAGGERLFMEALRHKSLNELQLSWIHMDIPLPEERSTPFARFPAKYRWDNKFKEVSKTFYPASKNTPAFDHCIYESK